MRTSRKVLIVDDEALIGMALADELAHRGFEIAGPYTSASRASDALDQDTPDIAMLDINLGKGRTSYSLADDLIALGIPIIFLTGYSELGQATARYPDAVVLAKPVSIDDAARTLERLLGDAPG